MFEKIKAYWQKKKQERQKREQAISEYYEGLKKEERQHREDHENEDLVKEDSEYDGWFGAGDEWFPPEFDEDQEDD